MPDEPARTATLAVTTLVLQNVVALVAIPGEVFVQHQLNLSAAAPLRHALVLGLAYSGQGLPILVYLPTEQAAREGGYGADSVTFLEPTAGRRLMQESLRDMRELMNGGGTLA